MKLNSLGTNETEVELSDNVTVFFSYRTPVAAWVDGKFYRTEYKWSQTTTHHINQWLGEASAVERPQSFFDNLV